MSNQTYLLLVTCAVSGVALVMLARAVVARPFSSRDLRWTLAYQTIGFAGMAPAMRAFTAAGDNGCYISMLAVTVALLAAWGRLGDAAAFLVNAIGGELLPYVIKIVVRRPRPSADQVNILRTIVIPSFPSGHVVRFVVFFGFLLALVYPDLPAGAIRTSFVVLVGLLLVGMGLSRVYVGEHWPSDILGGYLTGVCWLCAMLVSYGALRGAAPL